MDYLLTLLQEIAPVQPTQDFRHLESQRSVRRARLVTVAPAFPPVHERTGYSFEAVTSFIEDGASDEPLGRAKRGVYVSGGWWGRLREDL